MIFKKDLCAEMLQKQNLVIKLWTGLRHMVPDHKTCAITLQSVNHQIKIYNLAYVFCDYNSAVLEFFALIELWLIQH